MICIHCSEHIIYEKKQKKYVCVYIDGPPEGNWCQLPHPKKLTRSKVRVKTHSKILCVRNVPNGGRVTPQSSTILFLWSAFWWNSVIYKKNLKIFEKSSTLPAVFGLRDTPVMRIGRWYKRQRNLKLCANCSIKICFLFFWNDSICCHT